jgi:hypothetical protein
LITYEVCYFYDTRPVWFLLDPDMYTVSITWYLYGSIWFNVSRNTSKFNTFGTRRDTCGQRLLRLNIFPLHIHVGTNNIQSEKYTVTFANTSKKNILYSAIDMTNVLRKTRNRK